MLHGLSGDGLTLFNDLLAEQTEERKSGLEHFDGKLWH